MATQWSGIRPGPLRGSRSAQLSVRAHRVETAWDRDQFRRRRADSTATLSLEELRRVPRLAVKLTSRWQGLRVSLTWTIARRPSRER